MLKGLHDILWLDAVLQHLNSQILFPILITRRAPRWARGDANDVDYVKLCNAESRWVVPTEYQRYYCNYDESGENHRLLLHINKYYLNKRYVCSIGLLIHLMLAVVPRPKAVGHFSRCSSLYSRSFTVRAAMGNITDWVCKCPK